MQCCAHLACGVSRVGDGEDERQILHVAFIAAQSHEAGVQLGIQAGQVVHVAGPAQQLLDKEGC